MDEADSNATSSAPQTPDPDTEMLVDEPRLNRSDSPDQQSNQVVSLPMLLGAAAASALEVDFERMAAVPLLDRISDDWRSREVTDCSLIVLRLMVLRKVLHVDKIRLGELYPFLESSRYSQQMIKVPEKGFEIAAQGTQLSHKEFSQLLKDPKRQAFAYVGPGNYKSDSWVFLKLSDGRWLVLQFESKKRKPGTTISAAEVDAEFSKTFRLPTDSLGINLYVTDQIPDEAVPEIKKKGKKDNVLLGPSQHSQFYSLAYFIKAMLSTKTWGTKSSSDAEPMSES